MGIHLRPNFFKPTSYKNQGRLHQGGKQRENTCFGQMRAVNPSARVHNILIVTYMVSICACDGFPAQECLKIRQESIWMNRKETSFQQLLLINLIIPHPRLNTPISILRLLHSPCMTKEPSDCQLPVLLCVGCCRDISHHPSDATM